MATGFKNLTVYMPKEIFYDLNKLSEEIRRLFNHIIQNLKKYRDYL